MGLHAVVDWDALLSMLWVSSLAGVGVTAAYGFGLMASTRSVEHAREGRRGDAALMGLLGLLAFAVVLAAIAFGIYVMSE